MYKFVQKNKPFRFSFLRSKFLESLIFLVVPGNYSSCKLFKYQENLQIFIFFNKFMSVFM